MSALTRSLTAPRPALPRRLGAWLMERHGPVVLVPVLLLYGLAAATGAASESAASPARGLLVLGGLAAWTWFLLLRIADDLADRASDDALHPQRLLQRGVVSTRELGRLGIAAAVLCGAISVAIDGGLGLVTLLFALSLAFVGAAWLDFGLGRVLLDRPLLSRLLRTPASVLPVLWFAAIGSGGAAPTLAVGVLAVVALLLVVAIDVSRKFSPAVPGEPSWSGHLGTRRASVLLGGVLAALATASIVLLLTSSAATPASVVLLAVVGAAAAAGTAGGATSIALPGALLLTAIALVALVWGS